jgi:hypothetical protein
LIAGTPELYDDIVDDLGEARIANERDKKPCRLDVTVGVTEGDEAMGSEGVDDGGDGIDGNCGDWLGRVPTRRGGLARQRRRHEDEHE